MLSSRLILTALAALLAAGASPFITAAQAQPGPKGVITLPCCKCIGGKGTIVNINSGNAPGSVPYTVTGPGVGGPIAQTITNNINPLWTASLPPAKWIHANDNNGGSPQPGGTYIYSIRIMIPKCTIPMHVFLNGQAAADDSLRVYLDNNPIGASPTTQIFSPPPVPAGSGGWGFRSERIASFSWNGWTPMVSGMHVLRFVVVNGSRGPTGLLVRAALRTVCTDKVQSD